MIPVHPHPKPEKDNLKRGIFHALVGFFFFALVGVFFKASIIAGGNAAWANFTAFVIGSCVLSLFLFKTGLGFLKTQHFPVHFCRAFFGVLASFAYASSIHYVPLIDATLLYNATPLFIPIFSIFLLKIKPPLLIWAAIILGFIGIAFIIHPNLSIFDRPGDLLALGSGISLALAFTFIKLLSKTDPYFRIVFYFFFISTLLQIPFVFLFGPFPPLKSILFACAAGISLVLAQLNIADSYRFGPASEIGAFQYSAVIFIGLLDWVIWKVTPSPFDLIGTIIVIIAGVIIIKLTNRKKQKR